MKLNIHERIMLASILPTETDFVTWKIVNEAKGKLALSSEEIEEYAVKRIENRYEWNASGNERKEIELSDAACDLFRSALGKLDSEKKLTAAHVSVYGQLVGEEV